MHNCRQFAHAVKQVGSGPWAPMHGLGGRLLKNDSRVHNGGDCFAVAANPGQQERALSLQNYNYTDFPPRSTSSAPT